MRQRRLKIEEVIEIYKLSSGYQLSLAKIAERFNVSKTTVVHIRERRIRADVINLWLVLSSNSDCPKQKIEQVLSDAKAQIEQRQEKIKQVLPILRKSIQDRKIALKEA